MEMKKNWKPLLLIYLIAVAVRFVLALLLTEAPIVNIDEYLYFNIAKSMASSGEVLFNGQQANFSHLLYSIFLTPVYWIHGNFNYFRLLQLWSIMLINLSVFPAFALAKEMTGNRKEAFLLTILTLLMADFIFGAVLMAECLIIPLTLTAMWLGYRWLKEHQLKNALIIGLCLGLLYEAKPGAVATPAVLLLLMIIEVIRKKTLKELLHPVAGLAVGGGIILLFRLTFGTASVYTEQVSMPFGDYMNVFFTAMARYPAMFALAGGFGAVILPLMRLPRYSENDRNFLIAMLVALFASMVGTAWVINRYEFKTMIVHIRYLAIYLPVFLYFTAIPQERTPAGQKLPGGKKQPVQKTSIVFPIIAFAYTVIVLLIWGPNCMEKSRVSALAMSITKIVQGTPSLIILLVLAAVMTLVLIRQKNATKLKKACLYVAALWIIMNGFIGYSLVNGAQTGCMELDEIVEALDGRDYLYINTSPDNITTAGKLNAYTSTNAGHVDLNLLFNHMWENPGVYTPYVPENARGTIPDRNTADTNIFILDNTAYPLVSYAEGVRVITAPDNLLQYAEFTPGQRVFDSMIANVWNYVLDAGKPGIIGIFSPELKSVPLKVRLCLELSQEAEMTILTNSENYPVQLHAGRDWYEIDFTNPTDAMNFSVADCDIEIIGYELVPIA